MTLRPLYSLKQVAYQTVKSIFSFNLPLFIDLSNFKFPALDKQTESFLLRRKADLETSIKFLDGESETFTIFQIPSISMTASFDFSRCNSAIEKECSRR